MKIYRMYMQDECTLKKTHIFTEDNFSAFIETMQKVIELYSCGENNISLTIKNENGEDLHILIANGWSEDD